MTASPTIKTRRAAAFRTIAGTPGVQEADALAELTTQFPSVPRRSFLAAIRKAMALKWAAASAFAEFERGRWHSEDEAMAHLCASHPGFDLETYRAAWSDGRLLNQW